MGSEELFLFLLVFGVVPPFPCATTNSLNDTERLNGWKTTRVEMERNVAEKRIKTELKSKLQT